MTEFWNHIYNRDSRDLSFIPDGVVDPIATPTERSVAPLTWDADWKEAG